MQRLYIYSPFRLPHACGDEPLLKLITTDNEIVCPTHVGMNR